MMDMQFSQEDLSFREEVRTFLAESLPERLRDGARRSPGVFVEPDIGLEWHRILYEKGWVAYHWPKEDGGTGWTPVQKFIFEKECAQMCIRDRPYQTMRRQHERLDTNCRESLDRRGAAAFDRRPSAVG